MDLPKLTLAGFDLGALPHKGMLVDKLGSLGGLAVDHGLGTLTRALLTRVVTYVTCAS